MKDDDRKVNISLHQDLLVGNRDVLFTFFEAESHGDTLKISVMGSNQTSLELRPSYFNVFIADDLTSTGHWHTVNEDSFLPHT